MASPPPTRRPRNPPPGQITNAGINQPFPGLTLTFPEDFTLQNPVIYTNRLLKILQLSYRLSFVFDRSVDLGLWALVHSEWVTAIKRFIANSRPVDDQDYQVFQGVLQQVEQNLIEIRRNQNKRPDPDLHFRHLIVINQGLNSCVIQYRTNEGNYHASIFLDGVPADVVDGVIRHWLGEAVDHIDVLSKHFLGLGINEIVRRLSIIQNSPADAYVTLSDTMQLFSPRQNIALVYPGRSILLYTPALYYAIGAVVIADDLIKRVSPVASQSGRYVLNAADLQNIQQIVAPLGPVMPFGPGALAWLSIGVYDSVVMLSTRGRDVNVDLRDTPLRFIVNVTLNNNTTQQIDLFVDPTFLMRTPSIFPVSLANQFFSFTSRVFNHHLNDFYAPSNVDDVVSVVQVEYVLSPRIQKPRQFLGNGIDGNNIFWERVLLSKRCVLKGHLSQFVMFPSKKADGTPIHGCIYRAINCHCVVNTVDEPVICTCADPAITDSVSLDECKRACIEHGDVFAVFVIYIDKTDEHGKCRKSVELFHLGKNYYESAESKVIFVSMPLWNKVQGHCALWLPVLYQGACRTEEFRQFISKSRYNNILPLLTGKPENSYCPICGGDFVNNEAWSHFIRHRYKYICPSCGLVYDEENLLVDHVHWHCKNLPLRSSIILSDENVTFHDAVDSSTWNIVYADLESAILPETEDGERIHENILVGWVDTVNNVVQISREIKDFFNELVKLPATDILIYFHNGEGYDFHFVVRDLCDCRRGFVKNFSIVGDSGQKIRFFTVTYRGKNLHFRDSFAFVSESLDKWIKSSLLSGCAFPCFHANFDEYKQGILLRKNPFPYNAITRPEDLDRGIDELYGFARCDIAEELFCFKYSKEELIEFSNWLESNAHDCGWRTIYDYYVDYLKCDVSQLKDVMEFFEQNVQNEFGINIHDYYGTPSLSWAAWLRNNAVPLEPLTSSKRYDVVNSTIRGGQTGVFTRKYEQEKEGGVMFDLDCNALYATVMLKFEYPCHDWEEPEIPADLIRWIEELHSVGRSAFLEIDCCVKDNEYYYDYVPLASKRCLRGIYNYDAMRFYGTEDPVCMFFKGLTQVVGIHEHYCCHSRNLLWYLKHDIIEVKKVHFILSGKDEPVFRDYVQHNLNQRKKYAEDPIKKMLYKLLNNSLYGKTYEDETQRADYYLKREEDTNQDEIRRIICKMGEWTLFEGTKTQYFVNKPVYLGACITEFSKLWMYQFYYDRIKLSYPDARVYYTDTDALTILFPTGVKTLLDVARRLNTREEQVIDTSNFDQVPEEEMHRQHNNEPGLFKSETGDHAVVKFIGLRAKTYIMVCDNGSIKMSVKGCPMKEKERLNWEIFDRVLFSSGIGYEIEFTAIRSKFHMVKSVQLSKIVLSADDRKRYILPDLIHTLPLYCAQHLEAIQE